MIYVNLNKNERNEVIKILQNLKYTSELEDNYIIDCPFPFALDAQKRRYSCLTAVSHAAFVTANKKLLSKNEFYQILKSLK